MRRAIATAAVVGGALAMAGCGGETGAKEAARTANAFDRAMRARDFERGCALLTAGSRKRVAAAQSIAVSECPQALWIAWNPDPRMRNARPFSAADVEIDGDDATVAPRYWREAPGRLHRDRDGWRVVTPAS